MPKPDERTLDTLIECMTHLILMSEHKGVCFCGDDMSRHADPMHCGHTPVDQWESYMSTDIEHAMKLTGRTRAEIDEIIKQADGQYPDKAGIEEVFNALREQKG